MNQQLASLKEGEGVCLCFHGRGHSFGLLKSTFCSSFFKFCLSVGATRDPIWKYLLCAEDGASSRGSRSALAVYITGLMYKKSRWRGEGGGIGNMTRGWRCISLSRPMQKPGGNLVSMSTRCFPIFTTQLLSYLVNKLKHMCLNMYSKATLVKT